MHTGADLLTDKQHERLDALFAIDKHVEVEVTWWIYQRMIGAYRQPDRSKGRERMVQLIESISRGVPTALSELVTLGRTLKKRADDVLAYFDRPGTSNGPTEAINGRLEHLRGSVLGFREGLRQGPVSLAGRHGWQRSRHIRCRLLPACTGRLGSHGE